MSDPTPSSLGLLDTGAHTTASTESPMVSELSVRDRRPASASADPEVSGDGIFTLCGMDSESPRVHSSKLLLVVFACTLNPTTIANCNSDSVKGCGRGQVFSIGGRFHIIRYRANVVMALLGVARFNVWVLAFFIRFRVRNAKAVAVTRLGRLGAQQRTIGTW